MSVREMRLDWLKIEKNRKHPQEPQRMHEEYISHPPLREFGSRPRGTQTIGGWEWKLGFPHTKSILGPLSHLCSPT